MAFWFVAAIVAVICGGMMADNKSCSVFGWTILCLTIWPAIFVLMGIAAGLSGCVRARP
jgi:hypothetical protein